MASVDCGQEPPDPFRERRRIGARVEVGAFELAIVGMRHQGAEPAGVMDRDQGVVARADHEGRLADLREVGGAVEIQQHADASGCHRERRERSRGRGHRLVEFRLVRVDIGGVVAEHVSELLIGLRQPGVEQGGARLERGAEPRIGAIPAATDDERSSAFGRVERDRLHDGSASRMADEMGGRDPLLVHNGQHVVSDAADAVGAGRPIAAARAAVIHDDEIEPVLQGCNDAAPESPVAAESRDQNDRRSGPGPLVVEGAAVCRLQRRHARPLRPNPAMCRRRGNQAGTGRSGRAHIDGRR